MALGSIDTERYQSLLAEQGPETAATAEQQMAQLHPLGRVGRATEVADAVAYLLSGQASFITGAVVPVDGGRAARVRIPRRDGQARCPERWMRSRGRERAVVRFAPGP